MCLVVVVLQTYSSVSLTWPKNTHEKKSVSVSMLLKLTSLVCIVPEPVKFLVALDRSMVFVHCSKVFGLQKTKVEICTLIPFFWASAFSAKVIERIITITSVTAKTNKKKSRLPNGRVSVSENNLGASLLQGKDNQPILRS
jgi:hypothetical protein